MEIYAGDVAVERKTTEDGRSKVSAIFAPTKAAGTTALGQHASAQMVLLYDVSRTSNAGEIEVVDGYFVHYFAPEGLDVRNKHVIFVLDVSGSMQGEKLKQVKDAMRAILQEVKATDQFNIITFSTTISQWKPEMVNADNKHMSEALRFVEGLTDQSSTALFDAYQCGYEMLRSHHSADAVSMLILLTDGLPNVGPSQPNEIAAEVKKWNSETKFSIHNVAFGDDADYEFLKKISAQNCGIARKVFVDSDAALQLKGFYGEISSPLLSDVNVKYLEDTVDVDSVVLKSENDLFKGSEILITGRLKLTLRLADQSQESAKIIGSIQGQGSTGNCAFPIEHVVPIIPNPVGSKPERPVTGEPLPSSSVCGFVERMWAYLTIKKLLDEAKYKETEAEKQKEKKAKALLLSLKYHFVTELTSLVVTKESEERQLSEKPVSASYHSQFLARPSRQVCSMSSISKHEQHLYLASSQRQKVLRSSSGFPVQHFGAEGTLFGGTAVPQQQLIMINQSQSGIVQMSQATDKACFGGAVQGFSSPSPLMTAEQRLRKELLNWQKESDLHTDGFKAEPLKHADGSLDLFKWSIVIPGKKGTLWENGRFLMTMVFSNEYPKLPPKCICDPQLFHPNIGADGVVNFSFLDANNGWHQVATTKQILLLIQELLVKPSIDCANNPDALELFRFVCFSLNPAEYEDKIRKQTQRFSPAASSSN